MIPGAARTQAADMLSGAGIPAIVNYLPAQYKAHGQNFWLTQDKRRMVYSANTAGILEFDGAAWRLITTPENAMVLSIAADTKGRIMVGARGDMGYLSADAPVGNMKFISLRSRIDSQYRDFGEIIAVLPAAEGTYFIAPRIIFFYDGRRITAQQMQPDNIYAFMAGNIPMVFNRSMGLLALKNAAFSTILRGQISADIASAQMLPSGAMIIATRTNGLYRYNPSGNIVTEIHSAEDAWFRENRIRQIMLIAENVLAIASTRGGIALADTNGHILGLINRQSGLQDEQIRYMMMDDKGGIWAALNNGISRIDIASELTAFNEKNGLRGSVSSFIMHNGALYAGTTAGLFRQSGRTFLPIAAINTPVMALLSAGNELLIATPDGIKALLPALNSVRTITTRLCLTLYRSQNQPAVIFAGTLDSVLILRQENANPWHFTGTVQGISAEIREFAESDNALWMGSTSRGLFRAEYQGGTYSVVRRYASTEQGIPALAGTHLAMLDKDIIASTTTGIRVYNAAKDIFVPDSQRIKGFAGKWFSRIIQMPGGELLTTAGNDIQVAVYRPDSKGIYIRDTALLPMAEFSVSALYLAGTQLWIGGPDGAIRYDTRLKKNYSQPYSALIRQVIINGEKQLFGGTLMDESGAAKAQSALKITELLSSQNTLVFEFAAPFYDKPEDLKYQYFLMGFDQTWSAPSGDIRKEYTNLPPGSYTFMVRAINVYGHSSAEAVWKFEIGIPWYRTWWAVLLFSVAAGLIIYALIRWRLQKAENEKKALEKIIEERTGEVVRQKEEIEEKSSELADKNEELEKINEIVKAINSEIDFNALIQSIAERVLRLISGTKGTGALVFDKEQDAYICKAASGIPELVHAGMQAKASQVADLLIDHADEVYPDIFVWEGRRALARNVQPGNNPSYAIMAVKVEMFIEGYLLVELNDNSRSFEDKDIHLLHSLKEHIIAAFIKTRILGDLQLTLDNLQQTQAQLVQSEKLAEMGQLTAGIAHEIQNPLNFVNNFAELSADLAEELQDELEKQKNVLDPGDYDNFLDIAGMMEGNLKKIKEHGRRAESIVKNMLMHSRGQSGEFQNADLNALILEAVNLSYHGKRATNPDFNVAINKTTDPAIGSINVVPQDLSRVIINIVNNAWDALAERKKKDAAFQPAITVITQLAGQFAEIRIKDNGTGMPPHVVEKIFNPFFTTKPTGQGTGLGLSMSFDIITKLHKGRLEVETKDGEYTEFIIRIPLKQNAAIKA
jgi:signal transduction histidine kinase